MNEWTLGRRLAVGFAAMAALVAAMGVVSRHQAHRGYSDQLDRALARERALSGALALEASVHRRLSAARAELLARGRDDRQVAAGALGELRDAIGAQRGLVSAEECRRLVEEVERAAEAHRRAFEAVIAARGRGEDAAGLVEQLVPREAELAAAARVLVGHERDHAEAMRGELGTVMWRTDLRLAALTTIGVLVAAALAVWIHRGVFQRVSTVAQSVRASSRELETSSERQADGSRQQVSALDGVGAVVGDLKTAAHRIDDGAREVVRMAEHTRTLAASGGETIGKAHESGNQINEQMQHLAGHMLELGRKSHQIGGIVDLINELAEQTNILAINATIEATGAGEAGERFGAVADEIRKLADRVGGSTREIRTLIEEIRAAVNATVMATEGGNKAVAEGVARFAEVEIVFGRIREALGGTADAARGIESDCRGQGAVIARVTEGVERAVAAAREAEASSRRARETSVELAAVSRRLAALVRPVENGG